jgi:hypothetical protein
MSLLDTIIDKTIELVKPKEEETELLLEGHDPINRKIQAFKKGGIYWVEVDEMAISCKTRKLVELEFEFRINNSNRNL